ncbi:hypothetical protein QYM36_012449 [Artemia franciscana]|uniref:Uncharacterized protein n=1 Tax=Artemia franciscana TaxID=6661 RepID=A0AA88HFY4_ARTSF|nr:hypothetical protein QYM36_012449 [Artemia franciscana]
MFYGEHATVPTRKARVGSEDSKWSAFLVDNQFVPTANRGLQARAYTFLICKNNDYGGDTDVVLRIPFKTIVIAITAHHLVLNILAHWFRSSSPRHSEGSTRVEGLFTSNSTSRNPAKLSKSQLYLLLESVDLSFMSSLLFDSRPGLKFLVQKVACLDRAANCYKQIEMSWSSKFSLLIELVLHEVETVAEEDSVNAEEDDPLKNEFAKHLKHHLEKLIIFYKGAFSTIPSIAIGENIMRRYSVENKVSIESEFDGRIVATDESGMASNCSFDEKSWKEEDNYSSLTFRSCEYPNRRDDYSPSEKGQTKGTAKTARRNTCKERDETHDSVVDEERAQSLLKDRETRCCVANSMVASTLQTLGKLSKKDLKVLQPWLASTLGFLTEEVSSPMLRRGVAELLAAFNTVNTKN